MSDHLGNVRATFSDKRLAYVASLSNEDPITDYNLDVTSWSDYYAFGAIMPGRNATTPAYRYGFNGKEKDDEVSGNGNIYDYGFRIYNPRLGRFLSEDPLTSSYPWYTPYQFAGNKPIRFVDLDGLEEHDPIPEAYYNNTPKIDMNHAPDGSALNSAGFKRNGPWFWRQMRDSHKQMFSPDNLIQIKKGASPIVDDQWIKYNPEHASYKGEKLVHHHIDQGNVAAGIPEPVHQKWHKELHPVNAGGGKKSSSGRVKNTIKGVAKGAGKAAGAYGAGFEIFSTDPWTFKNLWWGGDIEAASVGQVYYNFGKSSYYQITSRRYEYDDEGKLLKTTIDLEFYDDYEEDEKTGNFVGKGNLGGGTTTINHKTGEVENGLRL